MQTTGNILMVRPAACGFNPETAGTNAFQKEVDLDLPAIQRLAANEFDDAVHILRSRGVNVIVYEDTAQPEKPDAVFPNNWVSFHADGSVVLYPMAAASRRSERRMDIINDLAESFEITEIVDLTRHEAGGQYLEGTGSLVFDHTARIAYASLSERTDEGLVDRVCGLLGYSPVKFRSTDQTGLEVYHTNVMMCIGSGFAVVCAESISTARERVIRSLNDTGHLVIEISIGQMHEFAGNMLALNGDILVLSQRARNVLNPAQVESLERFSQLVPLTIDTIETVGGGSARCMIAEVFLAERPPPASLDTYQQPVVKP